MATEVIIAPDFQRAPRHYAPFVGALHREGVAEAAIQFLKRPAIEDLYKPERWQLANARNLQLGEVAAGGERVMLIDGMGVTLAREVIQRLGCTAFVVVNALPAMQEAIPFHRAANAQSKEELAALLASHPGPTQQALGVSHVDALQYMQTLPRSMRTVVIGTGQPPVQQAWGRRFANIVHAHTEAVSNIGDPLVDWKQTLAGIVARPGSIAGSLV